MKGIKRTIILVLLIASASFVFAQKKLVPVSQSELTGVLLPSGTKQDKRLLMEETAKILLETESKKANTKLKNMEVLYLPAESVSGFNADSLVTQLSALGWQIIPIESDDKFVWLQKEGRYLVAYFLLDKKSTQLYFGEAITAPSLTAALQ